MSGPEGERAQFEVLMTSLGAAAPLARAGFSSQLPVGEDRWSELLRGAQGDPDLGAAFGEAEEMIVRVAHEDLGTSEVRAGRPFEPLRWSTGHDRRGPYARLVNHTAIPPSIRYFSPEHPATAEDVRSDPEGDLRFERGGLVVACCGELQAGTILPPHVSGGLDALRLLNVRPSLQTGPRTVESVRRCISLARLWGEVATAADATAESVQLARARGDLLPSRRAHQRTVLVGGRTSAARWSVADSGDGAWRASAAALTNDGSRRICSTVGASMVPTNAA